MSPKKKLQPYEFKSRILSKDMRWKYLEDKDRYLSESPAPKYKFNIIGAGMMGIEHISVCHFEGRSEIHGIYDPSKRVVKVNKLLAARDTGKRLKVYETLEEACSDPEVDGLIISSPNYTHIDVARVIAKVGKEKHVYMEKPMATTVEDAWEMTQIAKTHEIEGKVFQIGLQYRYKAIYQEAIHEVFERQSIGNIKTVNITKHRIPFLDKVNQWNKFNEFSGGTIVEKCCHYLDMINLFADGSKPKKVYATGSQAVNYKKLKYGEKGKKSDILDNAMAIIEYENGIQANFNLNMFAPQVYEELTVCGDRGRVRAYSNDDFLNNSIPKSMIEVYRGENHASRISHLNFPDFVEKAGHGGASFYMFIKFIDKIEGKSTLDGVPKIPTV
ncbi:MAG: Gfo/Idh/MocA family protein, partial [Promethearchaeota archaeon]